MLDVGCGTGNAALTARRSGADVVGVDLSHRMDDGGARTALRRDAVDVLEGWFGDNAIRVEYLQVRAVLE